ncbi:MAG: glycosyltransferase family 2 protein [Nitrospira sp.]|nr:glycosyltransferase family 2 protein [bacterium]MBL7048228.1 glycosyltransferase family 2 protein [Nitrospira sp.]
MDRFISIIIPNHNKGDTLALCLEAAFASEYSRYEVIVVDDRSTDNSINIIEKYPCKLICLDKKSGASVARNAGARVSKGDLLFFTDADCLLQKDTLFEVNRAMQAAGSETIIGGTYTSIPFDNDFFSSFQSVWIHYSETKHPDNPDYIASHAMAITTSTFRRGSGFPEDFMPIIEDVEYSHRLKREGCRLIMESRIQVRHIFNFSLARSLKNAYRKSMYWMLYSLKNRDVLSDSGTASVELKLNVASFFICALLIVIAAVLMKPFAAITALFIFTLNILYNARLGIYFKRQRGTVFALKAFIYYLLCYPLPIGMGTASALFRHLTGRA